MAEKSGTNRSDKLTMPNHLKEIADLADRLKKLDESDSMLKFRIRVPYSTPDSMRAPRWHDHELK